MSTDRTPALSQSAQIDPDKIVLAGVPGMRIRACLAASVQSADAGGHVSATDAHERSKIMAKPTPASIPAHSWAWVTEKTGLKLRLTPHGL